MKATISKKGIITVEPETEAECYLMKKWTEENNPIICSGLLVKTDTENNVEGVKL